MTPGAPGNLFAVASGKGGVGKTWLAATLAQLLARSGRRVLLFDGDIGLANIDVQLGLTAPKHLGDVMQDRASLRDVILEYTSQLHIIAGCSGSGTLATQPVEKLQQLIAQLQELAQEYDVVLLDLGAGIEEHVRALAAIATRCLIVVTDEPTSLTDAYAFIKICVTTHPSMTIDIIVNQAQSLKEGEKTFLSLHKACLNFLKISPPCLGVIRKDGKVRDAIRRQQPLINFAPHCTAASDVASIAIKLMQKRG